MNTGSACLAQSQGLCWTTKVESSSRAAHLNERKVVQDPAQQTKRIEGKTPMYHIPGINWLPFCHVCFRYLILTGIKLHIHQNVTTNSFPFFPLNECHYLNCYLSFPHILLYFYYILRYYLPLPYILPHPPYSTLENLKEPSFGLLHLPSSQWAHLFQRLEYLVYTDDPSKWHFLSFSPELETHISNCVLNASIQQAPQT